MQELSISSEETSCVRSKREIQTSALWRGFRVLHGWNSAVVEVFHTG